MKIVSIMWNAYVPILQRAAAAADADLTIFPNRILEESPEQCEKAIRACESADVLLLYRTSHMFWTGMEDEIRRIRKKVPVICVGYEPSYWELSTVDHAVAANCYAYLTYNGEENLRQMFRYIKSVIRRTGEQVPPPAPVPWQGLYHPDSPNAFIRTDDYLAWYRSRREYDERPWVGLLLSRVAWVSQSLAIEDTLIRQLEAQDLNVIPVFTYSIRDDDLGARGMAEVIREYLTLGGKPRVQAIVKLVSFMVGAAKGSESDAKSAESGSELLARLNIPVFQPVITFYKSLEDWETSSGITDDVTWCVAMPEF
ncbi:MAG: cobaltochelatase subunit CobN, partial [Methanoregulaceae archaeon]